MMTKELYYESAYISEFFAEVIKCERSENKAYKGRYEVVLDRTAFFPEQGGQGSDIGVLEFDDGKSVAGIEHVSIGSEIRHIADKEIPVGTRVRGVIDFARRFSNMQQHTGEHIFSGLVNSEYGYNNVGFHLSDSEVTMDYDGVLTAENIRKLEIKANEAIWANLDVICEFPEADKLSEIPYRSKKELSGDVRIVTIPGIDICACCAPHVNRTGESRILLRNEEEALEIYFLSCAAIDIDHFMERSYLNALGDALKIPQDVREGIERDLEQQKRTLAE